MSNIFSINDLSNLKVESYDGSNFYWMDNFYVDADLVYDYITSIEPPIWKDWESPSHNMVYFEDRRHMINNPDMDICTNPLSKILGQSLSVDFNVVTNFTRFKKDPFNDYKLNAKESKNMTNEEIKMHLQLQLAKFSDDLLIWSNELVNTKSLLKSFNFLEKGYYKSGVRFYHNSYSHIFNFYKR